MHERILRTLQHLCLTELKINRYHFDNAMYSNNYAGTYWAAFHYQLEGEIEFASNTYTVRAKPGDLYYIPQNHRFEHYSVGDKPTTFYVIAFSFRESEGNRFDAKYGLSKINLFDKAEGDAFFSEMFEHFAQDDEKKLLAVSDFYRLFSSSLRDLVEAQPFQLHPALQAAIDYINEHLTEDFDVKDVADHAMLSESRLYHIFAEQLHTSPIRYKNLCKVRAAFVLLTTTDLSIAEIASKLNFGSTTNFRAAFAGVTHVTPKEYRKIFKTNDWSDRA